jgi:hypothetical protein
LLGEFSLRGVSEPMELFTVKHQTRGKS